MSFEPGLAIHNSGKYKGLIFVAICSDVYYHCVVTYINGTFGHDGHHCNHNLHMVITMHHHIGRDWALGVVTNYYVLLYITANLNTPA